MSNWSVYILLLSVISVYYISRMSFSWLEECVVELKKGIIHIFSICVIRKEFITKNVEICTPTEFVIQHIMFIWQEIKTLLYAICYVLLAIIVPIVIIALIYWFFTADHANSSWIWYVQKLWWIWYLFRGTIFFLFVGAAWKQLKTFPKIIYFKDLCFVISRSFLLIYLVVVIFTIVEVIKAIAFGEIHTPLYMYYVDWYQQIIG